MKLEIAAVAIVAVACATPYQPMGALGGFEEQRMPGNRWLIHVSGNGYTSQGTIYGYFQRRASELCQSAFDVIDQQAGARQGPTWVHSTGNGNAIVTTTSKPEISGVVECRVTAPTAPAAITAPPPPAEVPPPADDDDAGGVSVLSSDAPIHGEWTVVGGSSANQGVSGISALVTAPPPPPPPREVDVTLPQRQTFVSDENTKAQRDGREVHYLLVGADREVLQILSADCNGDRPLLVYTSDERAKLRALGFVRATCRGPQGEQSIDL